MWQLLWPWFGTRWQANENGLNAIRYFSSLMTLDESCIRELVRMIRDEQDLQRITILAAELNRLLTAGGKPFPRPATDEKPKSS